MKTRHTLILALPVLLLVGCAPVEQTSKASETTDAPVTATMSTTSTTAKPTECQPVPPQVMADISKGLYSMYKAVTFSDAYYVIVDSDNRNSQGWPGHVVAARVVGDGFSDGDIATWAIGPIDGNISPLYALNKKALQATDWGSAAREGSPADQQRKRIEKLDETKQAEKCAKERKAS